MIGVIEQAIIDRIAEFSRAGHLGYALRTVRSYAGELEDAEAFAAAAKAFPAVLILYAGEAEPSDAGGALICRPRFNLYVCQASRRNEAASRTGATSAEVGSYQILRDVQSLLWQQMFGLAIAPLSIGAVESVIQADGISVFRFSVATELTMQAIVSPATITDFLHVHVGWDIPAHGNIPRTLPASPADAEDLIDLRGASE